MIRSVRVNVKRDGPTAPRVASDEQRVVRSGAVMLLSVAMVMLLIVGGCEGLGSSDRRPQRTGGDSLLLWIAKPAEQSYELFRVTPAGDLEYGGGMAAFNSNTTWSGAMTDAEIASFRSLLARTGWCNGFPESDRESSVRVRLEVWCDTRQRTWEGRGEPSSVTEMRTLLEPIARRRFDAALERLPEASDRRSMTIGTPRPEERRAAPPSSGDGAGTGAEPSEPNP